MYFNRDCRSRVSDYFGIGRNELDSIVIYHLAEHKETTNEKKKQKQK